MIVPVLEGRVKSFEIRPEVHLSYNDWLQKRLTGTVWNKCSSYYQVDGKLGSRITATFPGTVTRFWWIAKTHSWKNWKVVGGDDGWLRDQKLRKFKIWAAFAMLAGAYVGVWYMQLYRLFVEKYKGIIF
jgi:hypothetical protein